MNLKAIATLLANGGAGQLAKTIFVNDMPTDCAEGILLMSPYHGTAVNHYLPDLYEPEFQVVIRATDYLAGMAKAEQVRNLLLIRGEQTVDTILIKQCLPLNLPRPYRRSVAGYWEFELDVQLTYVQLPQT